MLFLSKFFYTNYTFANILFSQMQLGNISPIAKWYVSGTLKLDPYRKQGSYIDAMWVFDLQSDEIL